MSAISKIQDKAQDRASDARGQIADLRKQVDMLMRDRVSPALSSASSYADRGYSQAADYASDGADAVSGQVKDRPITAVLLAGAIGFVLGRVTK